ncbi:MAG: hypothetical protein ACE3JP_04225 [Ectobacillus sp.]
MNDKKKQLIRNVTAGVIVVLTVAVILWGNIHFKEQVKNATKIQGTVEVNGGTTGE